MTTVALFVGVELDSFVSFVAIAVAEAAGGDKRLVDVAAVSKCTEAARNRLAQRLVRQIGECEAVVVYHLDFGQRTLGPKPYLEKLDYRTFAMEAVAIVGMLELATIVALFVGVDAFQSDSSVRFVEIAVAEAVEGYTRLVDVAAAAVVASYRVIPIQIPV